MKNLFLTLIICIFAFLNSSAAQESEFSVSEQAENPCARYQNIRPKLRLRSSYGRLRYSREYDSENLGIMTTRRSLDESETFVAGLSLVDIDWSVSLNMISRTNGDTTCVIPASVDVFVGYRNPIIYISSDLEEGSCRYQVAVRHERQHQQVNIILLEHYLPIIKSELQEALSIITAREVKDDEDSDKVIDDINSEYTEILRRLINRFQATMDYENSRLDSRENYRYENDICPN